MKKYALIALLAIASSTPAFAEGFKPSFPSMAIKGEGIYGVAPDYATFTLTVQTRNSNSEKGLAQHATKIEAVSALLEKLKAEGLQVKKANFSSKTEQMMQRSPNNFNPNQPINKPNGPPEYVMTTVYHLKTDKIDKDSLVKISSLLSVGDLYTLSNMTFSSYEPRKAELEARKKAVLDAREQAEAYASAANMKLLEIVDITDSDASYYRYGAEEGAADLPTRKLALGKWVKVTEIIPPEILAFRANVNIMWKIAPKE